VLRPPLWLEDAGVFLLGEQVRGVRSLVDPYNGTLLMVPRLLALLTDIAPVRWTASLYAILAAVFAVACCALVLSDRLNWLF